MLINDKLKEMQSTKVITTLRVRGKKPVKFVITLDPEDVDVALDIGNNTDDNYIRVETSFNRLLTEFFKGSDMAEQIQHILLILRRK